MQTFLPYADFERSARSLDLKRLGKQRVEVVQCVRALTVPGYAWKTHPAVLMWQGYEEALGRYGLVICDVWVEHGFGDTCAASITDDLATSGISPIRSEEALRAADAMPPWDVDGDPVLESHRSALVRKDPERYGPMFPDAPVDVPYVWPVRSASVVEAERRKAANAVLREQRRLAKLDEEAEKKRRQRSAAAKRGAKTRADKKRVEQQGS
ncbi:MAG: MSMEG_6728 family protein [Janthinobacterium lividum]